MDGPVSVYDMLYQPDSEPLAGPKQWTGSLKRVRHCSHLKEVYYTFKASLRNNIVSLNIFLYFKLYLQVANGEVDTPEVKKKKKKQAVEDMEAEASPAAENGAEETTTKKKKKRKSEAVEAQAEEAAATDNGAEDTPAKKKKKQKAEAEDAEPAEEAAETPVSEKKKKKKKKEAAEWKKKMLTKTESYFLSVQFIFIHYTV